MTKRGPEMLICPWCGFPFNPKLTYKGEERKRPGGRKRAFCKTTCMNRFFAAELKYRRAQMRARALERRWEAHGQNVLFREADPHVHV